MKKLIPANAKYLLLLIPGFFAACKTQETSVRAVKKEIRSDYILMKNPDLELRYTQLSFKGDGRHESKEESNGFTYKINVYKDSMIWISVSKLGIEGMRMLVSKDSIKMIDRLHKEYYCGNFNYFYSVTGIHVTFDELQRVFTGDISFILDSLSADAKANVPNKFTGKKDKTEISYILSGENFKVKEIEAETSKHEKIFISYSDYILIKEQPIPKFLLLQIIRPEKNVFRFIHTRIEIDPEDLTFNFNIPPNYVQKILE